MPDARRSQPCDAAPSRVRWQSEWRGAEPRHEMGINNPPIHVQELQQLTP